MRPVELTLRGFKSYLEEMSLSFDGRTLFGIVGPTGAGKSSILEGIVFALYGKAPGRDERETSKLINTGSGDAHIRLIFEAEGSLWEVTRVLRRNRASEVVLRRRGLDAPDSKGATAVNRRVEELIGLDFKAFCSSVMLPQGEFDRFLSASVTDRSKILKGIFGLERVDGLRELARLRRDELTGGLSQLEAEAQSLTQVPGALDDLRRDKSEAEAALLEIREALSGAAQAEAELRLIEETTRAIEEDIAEIGALRGEIPAPSEIEGLVAEDEEAGIAVASASERLNKAVLRLEAARAALTEAESQTGGEQLLGRAAELIRDRDRVGQHHSVLEASRPAIEAAASDSAKKVAGVAQRVSAATDAVVSAREARDGVLHQHAVHLLRKGVTKGDPCPVCDRPVDKLPPAGRAPGLKAADAVVASAESKLAAAGEAHSRAERAHAVAAERLAQLDSQVSTVTAERAQLDRTLTDLLGSVKDFAAEALRRAQIVERARDAAETAREEHEKASAGQHDAAQRAETHAAELRRHAAVLIKVCGRLRIPGPDFDSGSSQLLDCAKRAADAATTRIDGRRRELAQAGSASAKFADVVITFRKRFGLEEGAPVTQALERAIARVGSLDAEIDHVERVIARAAEIDQEVERARKTREIYTRLAADLTDRGFIAYLLEGQRRVLSQLASEKLFELTRRYRFDEEGDFQIVDVRNESTRSPDTLSGGETFLASLALALAMAEAVAQGGGRLGCFFLDEGFGSLDPESLDQALEGIESLAVPDRLIGLISHVRDLQNEMDDLIVLDKDAAGCTLVLQTEGPIGIAAPAI